MIEVRDLEVSYGDFTLREVNLQLPRGGCLAILGPSGAGKTLLLESVMGARRPKRGCVLLDGVNVTDAPPEARRIAYIPQDLALFPHLSVRDNVVFGLRTRTARKEAAEDVSRLAGLLRIAHLLDRRNVATLSGGEKQRVALARALIVQPRVLFLDEPFVALDAASRADLLNVFRQLRRELGATVFLVTHSLDEACFLADDIAIMMAGRIVESGPPERVIRRPRTVPVARFLNLRNIFPLPLPDGFLREVQPEADSTHVAVRPEDIAVRPWGGHSIDDRRGRLEDLILVGSHAVARVTLQDTLRLEVSLSHDAAALLVDEVNKEVAVSVQPQRMIFLSDR